MEQARETGDPSLRFLRGAMWRNFQRRYREVNDLHKQMLRVSAKVAAMPDGPDRARASDHLYQGQSNDCYWHGLFGGLYIVHMRMATLAHLIAAEDLADAGLPGTRVDDHDLDGRDEVLLGAAGQSVLVDLAEGGGIGAWDLLASRVALASVIRRRPEPYHAALLDEVAAAAAGDGGPAADGTTPRSPHEGLRAKEAGLARVLRFDTHERRSGLVHILPAADGIGLDDVDRGPDALAELRLVDLGDFADAEYQLVDLVGPELTVRRDGNVALPSQGAVPLGVTKRLSLGGERLGPTLELTVALRNPGAGTLRFELDVEWDFNLMGGGGNPAAYYEVLADPAGSDPDAAVHGTTGQVTAQRGERMRHDTPGELRDASRLAFGNDDAGVRIDLTVTPPARLTWYPVETVSKSESGFERVYQGSSLHARWPVSLEPDAESTVVMHFAVHESRDLAAEEQAIMSERPVRGTRRATAVHPSSASSRRSRSDH
jgi:alpha-amylase